uniref:Protein disulfide Isomerase n=1 Tax=Nucleocytoviricota sp. TaxID=2809609 RepID=A0A9E8G3V8_9VIRU|nr:protein disulfide Isomerase [Nucleocytoviricota sp.]UZT29192.1 protein disulfide Isomerase [Nucleocytoviricota sp.]
MDKLSNLKKTISNNIISSINDIKSKPESLILPIFIILLFSIISYILFSKNIKEFINKKFVLNKEFVNKNTDNNNNATIIYFYTEWCPYCKKSRPEWNSFKDLVDLQSFKETLTLKEVDCDKNPEIADNYKIEGYPTIKLIYNGEVYDYDAKPESKTLLQFVESIIYQN